MASKTEILDHVWGIDFAGDPNVVEVYVGYLRKKIDAPVRRRDDPRPCGARGTNWFPMSDDSGRQLRLWPQTVRVRLTRRRHPRVRDHHQRGGVRSGAKLVHTNLVDRIQETNQQQLDALQAQVDRGELQPRTRSTVRLRQRHPAGCASGRHPIAAATRPRNARSTRRPGNITLVAQQSLDEVEPHRQLGDRRAPVRRARDDRAGRASPPGTSPGARCGRSRRSGAKPSRSPARPCTGASPSPTPTTRSAGSPAP